MFTDGVHLMDIGAGGEQQTGDRALLLERDRHGRQRRQRRSATRDEADDQISAPGRSGDLRDAFRARHAARIGLGMAAFVQLDAAKLHRVAVFDVDVSGRDPPPKNALGGLGH